MEDPRHGKWVKPLVNPNPHFSLSEVMNSKINTGCFARNSLPDIDMSELKNGRSRFL
jgi:hypothetical protein